jgi:multicomponent Na+:H+ antiporter subunit E
MSALWHYLTWPLRILWFIVFFLWELTLSNVRVAWEALTPGFTMQAGIVRVHTRCRNRWELISLANTITMTPGTLTLEVDTDTNDLFVHSLYVTDRESFQAQISRLEDHLLKAMR